MRKAFLSAGALILSLVAGLGEVFPQRADAGNIEAGSADRLPVRPVVGPLLSLDVLSDCKIAVANRAKKENPAYEIDVIYDPDFDRTYKKSRAQGLVHDTAEKTRRYRGLMKIHVGTVQITQHYSCLFTQKGDTSAWQYNHADLGGREYH